jgi:hypothetical protein
LFRSNSPRLVPIHGATAQRHSDTLAKQVHNAPPHRDASATARVDFLTHVFERADTASLLKLIYHSHSALTHTMHTTDGSQSRPDQGVLARRRNHLDIVCGTQVAANLALKPNSESQHGLEAASMLQCSSSYYTTYRLSATFSLHTVSVQGTGGLVMNALLVGHRRKHTLETSNPPLPQAAATLGLSREGSPRWV